MWNDIRFSLRLLRLSPGFAIVAVASLALGAGANTAIFQLFDTIRLRTLPVKSPQQLVELRIADMTHARGTWLRDVALTNPLWEQIHRYEQAFSGTFAWADEDFDISANGESHRIKGLWVSGDFFHTLGITPLVGRVFTSKDDQRGCGFSPGAVLSYGYWQREFGGNPSLIGREITLGKSRVVVTGVTPPSFFGLQVGRTFDIALPICSEPALHANSDRLTSGITWWLTVMGRLRPGISTRQAESILAVSSAAVFRATLPAGYPPESVKPYLAMKLLAVPAGRGLSSLREQYSQPLILLLAIASLVLLIACTNLASLMLARTSARERDLAVRLAMGASRARLARQLLTEGLLLSIAGAGLGLLLANMLSRFLVGLLSAPNDPLFVDLSQNLRIFAFATLLAVLTCLVLPPCLCSERQASSPARS